MPDREAAGPSISRVRHAERPRRSHTGRADLLAAGVDLVNKWSVGDALGHLKISDLARTAGVTSGAFYHYWPNQDAYRHDVLAYLLAGDRVEAAADFLPVCTDQDDGTVSTILAAADQTFETIAADPHQRLMLGLWAQHDGTSHAALATRSSRAAERWSGRVGRLLQRVGRAPRQPWTLDDIGRVLVALSDGLAIQHLTDPSVLSERDGRHPASLLVLALLLGATEPSPVPVAAPAGPADLPPVDAGPEARRRLLDVGAEAAMAQPVGNALDHIRAQDIVERVGRTVGAFYHYWATQDDYRDDLIEALFQAGRYVSADTVAGLGAEITTAVSLEDAVRDGTSWYWEIAAEHPDNAVHYGFLSLGDPFVQQRLATETAELRGAWHGVTTGLLAAFDRDLLPGLSVEMIVMGMAAAIDGLIVAHGLGLGAREPLPGDWTTWGATCHALLRATTAPRGEAKEDLVAVAEAAFSTTEEYTNPGS